MSNPFNANDASRGAVHLTPDQIFDLTHGLLDRKEASAAMGHVRECLRCGEVLRECATSAESIAAGPQPTVLAGGKIVLEEREPVIPLEQPLRLGRVRSTRRPGVALGAILSTAVAASLLVFALRPPTETPAAKPYWVPVETRAVSRGPELEAEALDARSSDSAFDAALDAYARRNLSRAIEGLEALRPLDDAQPLRRLYLASAYLLDGQSERAVDILDPLDIESLPQPWRNRARWTLYLATRDAGYRARAHPLLEKLTAEAGQIGDLARAEAARLH